MEVPKLVLLESLYSGSNVYCVAIVKFHLLTLRVTQSAARYGGSRSKLTALSQLRVGYSQNHQFCTSQLTQVYWPRIKILDIE